MKPDYPPRLFPALAINVLANIDLNCAEAALRIQ
jgi:hypothetical protein